MKNLTLKLGDTVQVTELNDKMTEMGFMVGQTYAVEGTPQERQAGSTSSILAIRGPKGSLTLTWPNNTLTDHAYCVKLLKCPLVLTKGYGSSFSN
jgi:hypothetical protein